MSIFSLLYKDYKQYSKWSRVPLHPFVNLGLYMNIIYRISQLFASIKFYPIAKLFWLLNRILFGVDIEPKSKLAGGLVIVHGCGIVIGSYVETFGPMKIYQGATLGANFNKKKIVNNIEISMPKIYPGVIIGINSVVVGPIVIGRNSIIGSNAVVTKDVDEDSTIVGVNKKLTRNSNTNEKN